MENNYDLNSNLDFILNHNLKTDIKNKIILQEKLCNSKNFNDSFKYIEDSLNFLYEKNRILQDIIKYSKIFLTNEIDSSILDCKTLLQSIEDDKDLIKNKTYIKYVVPFFYNANSNIIDRDNSILANTVIYNNSIYPSDKILENYVIDYFNVNKNNNCIYTNSNQYLSNNNYRSLYVFDSIQSSYIKETITLKFNKTIKMNKLNINLSNCKIEKVILTLENNKTKELDINKLNLFDSEYVDSIEIKISCSNYSVSQTLNKDINDNNFTSIIDNINIDENTIIDNKKYYYYLFGIDKINIQLVKINNFSGFCSQPINIGNLNKNQYLALHAEESIERGSIEYYLINNSSLIPILPENQNTIKNEYIFYKTPTRFAIDKNSPITIKCNNEIVNLSLFEAINKNDGNIYTIDYTPIIKPIDSLNNENVQIKIIFRSYDQNFVSFIKKIKLKKYGGKVYELK